MHKGKWEKTQSMSLQKTKHKVCKRGQEEQKKYKTAVCKLAIESPFISVIKYKRVKL